MGRKDELLFVLSKKNKNNLDCWKRHQMACSPKNSGGGGIPQSSETPAELSARIVQIYFQLLLSQ